MRVVIEERIPTPKDATTLYVEGVHILNSLVDDEVDSVFRMITKNCTTLQHQHRGSRQLICVRTSRRGARYQPETRSEIGRRITPCLRSAQTGISYITTCQGVDPRRNNSRHERGPTIVENSERTGS